MESTEKESGKWLIPLMMILLGFAVVFGIAIVIIYIYGVDGFLPSLKIQQDWGVVGDFFGGILNPVFAFLGLIMLLATLYQSQKELALTRAELSSSKRALEDQALTQKQQRFENTFFALLAKHNEAILKIDYVFPWIKFYEEEINKNVVWNVRELFYNEFDKNNKSTIVFFFLYIFIKFN